MHLPFISKLEPTYDSEPEDRLVIRRQSTDDLREETGEETNTASEEEERERGFARAESAEHEPEQKRRNVHDAEDDQIEMPVSRQQIGGG